MSRTSASLGPHRDDSDWDLTMRDALNRESVEVLRHQVEVERVSRARVQRSDGLFAVAVFGVAMGLSYGMSRFEMQHPFKKTKRKGRSRA